MDLNQRPSLRQVPHVGMYQSLEIRTEVCYHCSNNARGQPVITEQWIKYFGEGMPVAWECSECKQLMPEADHQLVA